MQNTFTPAQLALKAHIEASNVAFSAQAAANGWQVCGEIDSDPAYWATRGISTVAEYDSAMLRGDFSDFYKDDNGIRPDLSQWTDADIEMWFASRARMRAAIADLR